MKTTPLNIDALLAFHKAHFGDARMENGEDSTGSDTSGDVAPDADDARTTRDDSDTDDTLGDAGKRAIQEERRRAREARNAAKTAEERAAAAEARLAEIEREKMSAQERAEVERDDWRRKYEEQQAELARLSLDITRREVAAEKGIPDWMARRLQGSTREELEADAEAALADLRKVAPPSPYPPNTPKPDPNQGPTGQGGGRPTSVEDAKAEYLARTKRAQTH